MVAGSIAIITSIIIIIIIIITYPILNIPIPARCIIKSLHIYKCKHTLFPTGHTITSILQPINRFSPLPPASLHLLYTSHISDLSSWFFSWCLSWGLSGIYYSISNLRNRIKSICLCPKGT